MSTPSKWTIETLHEHLSALRETDLNRFDERFESQKAAVQAAMSAADRAVLKSEADASERFRNVNEFRAALSDQQKTLITRTEVQAIERAISQKHEAQAAMLDRLTATVDKLQSERQGTKGGWTAAVSVAGFVLTLVTLVAIAVSVWKR